MTKSNVQYEAVKLVEAYYQYSRDIGENMTKNDIQDRVERLVKYEEDMFYSEIENMKKKGYYK